MSVVSGGIGQTTALPAAPPLGQHPATEVIPPSGGAPRARHEVRSHVRHLAAVVVTVTGLVVVGLLVWLTTLVNDHNQLHLLRLQVKQAGAVLGEAVPTVQTSLTAAVAVAESTGGDGAKVAEYVAGDVGTSKHDRFRSLSLWELPPGSPAHRLLSLGRPSSLGARPGAVPSFLDHVRPNQLAVTGTVGGPLPYLGFAVASLGTAPRYAVYAEAPLPADRKATVPPTSAFHDLDFALYLGRSPSAKGLIETTSKLPLAGPTASTVIPFGTRQLDFVASPTGPLGGGLLPALPWVIGAGGVVLTAAGALMAERLTRRRLLAEVLARENHRLYSEQRSLAQSLQTALLPQELPEVPGIEISARYVAGDQVADIGGDWYDVIRSGDDGFLFVVGDVSGRGIPAAKTMASLHYAIRAYAGEGDDPATILTKLGNLLDVSRDGQFATVLLGHADVDRHQVTVVNAGHLPPLVVAGADSHFATTSVGAPIGVASGVSYQAVTCDVPRRASVIAYTDGLVERRGELLDVGLERFRTVASHHRGSPDGLLDMVIRELTADGAADDVALLELRWTS